VYTCEFSRHALNAAGRLTDDLNRANGRIVAAVAKALHGL
jgi:hypothetical protein